ncbi:unnamed protein product [Clonostachys rosea]|uniref:Uncharacterized protein n=1 Tax=Bionectria ochroleuca TaxID=29856 RepID=A0ABY6UTX7_BIOOC|nr:unnamed protein product [Clonostachys rosea]
MPSTTQEPYYLPGYNSLTLGYRISTVSNIELAIMNNEHEPKLDPRCHPSPGIYRARDLVEITAPLLNSILQGLGSDDSAELPSSQVLIDGLAASLAVTGRESTLPLSYGRSDTSRKEISEQAQKIGQVLVGYAKEFIQDYSSKQTPIKLYSQCEGHLWTPQVASLLLGPRSNAQLMQLYNEWLHRMILLRDALLPFENFAELPLVIPSTSKHGLRDFEEPRKEFLLQCLTGRISQAAIVDVAKIFTERSLASGGYGIQYSQGLILPAFLSSSPSIHLLRHHPARLDDSQINILFDYEHPVYFDAERSDLPKTSNSLPPGHWPPTSLLALNPQVTKSSFGVHKANDPLRRVLKLGISLDGAQPFAIDIGQIARGHRYAYRCDSGEEKKRPFQSDDAEELVSQKSTQNGSKINSLHIYDTAKILGLPGFVTSDGESRSDDLHLFVAKDPLIQMALLGKLYPENVILIDEDDDPDKALKVGKGFGGRLVVIQSKRRKVSE